MGRRNDRRPGDKPVGRLGRPTPSADSPKRTPRRSGPTCARWFCRGANSGARVSADDREPRSAAWCCPISTRYLIDNVIGKHQMELLTPLVLAVLRRDPDSGRDFVYSHAASFQSRTAPDRRTAPESPAAHRPAAGRLLRRQQERRAGFAHHERRGRRAQPDRHRPGRIRRRPDDRRDLAGRVAAHQPADDRVTAAVRGGRSPSC